ncbi:MAG: hypothetical protein NC548_38110 [Lachnospiraceae bacterium]|nr:hypothetical protein [Lachnospiraceae bacterium]
MMNEFNLIDFDGHMFNFPFVKKYEVFSYEKEIDIKISLIDSSFGLSEMYGFIDFLMDFFKNIEGVRRFDFVPEFNAFMISIKRGKNG